MCVCVCTYITTLSEFDPESHPREHLPTSHGRASQTSRNRFDSSVLLLGRCRAAGPEKEKSRMG